MSHWPHGVYLYSGSHCPLSSQLRHIKWLLQRMFPAVPPLLYSVFIPLHDLL